MHAHMTHWHIWGDNDYNPEMYGRLMHHSTSRDKSHRKFDAILEIIYTDIAGTALQ